MPDTNFEGMRLILHIGMPKTASTSFQMSLSENRSMLLAKYRLGYYPDSESINNSILYFFKNKTAEFELENYIKNILSLGSKDGADTVIVSTERLFMDDDIKCKINLIAIILNKYGVHLDVLIVMKDIESFVYSYLKQLIYNGALSTITDKNLVAWTVQQLQKCVQSDAAVLVAQLDPLIHSGNFIDGLLAKLGFHDAKLALRHDNKTPSREMGYAVIEGCLANFHGVLNDWDVNSQKMDELRTIWRQKYDSLGQELFFALKDLSVDVEAAIDEYVSESIRCAPGNLMQFYNDIRSQPTFFSDGNPLQYAVDEITLRRARLSRVRNWAGHAQW